MSSRRVPVSARRKSPCPLDSHTPPTRLRPPTHPSRHRERLNQDGRTILNNHDNLHCLPDRRLYVSLRRQCLDGRCRRRPAQGRRVVSLGFEGSLHHSLPRQGDKGGCMREKRDVWERSIRERVELRGCKHVGSPAPGWRHERVCARLWVETGGPNASSATDSRRREGGGTMPTRGKTSEEVAQRDSDFFRLKKLCSSFSFRAVRTREVLRKRVDFEESGCDVMTVLRSAFGGMKWDPKEETARRGWKVESVGAC